MEQKKKNRPKGLAQVGLVLLVMGLIAGLYYGIPALGRSSLARRIETDPVNGAPYVVELGAEGVAIMKKKLRHSDFYERLKGLILLEGILADEKLYREKKMDFRGKMLSFRKYLLTDQGVDIYFAARDSLVFPNEEVRGKALAVLLALSAKPEAARLMDQAERTRIAVMSGYAEPDAGVGEMSMNLESALESDNAVTVYQGVVCASLYGERELLPGIRKALSSEHAPVREYAARALALFGKMTDEASVIELLETERNPGVRFFAFRALGALGSSESAEYIADAIDDISMDNFQSAVVSFLSITGADCCPEEDKLDKVSSRSSVEAAVVRAWESLGNGCDARQCRRKAAWHPIEDVRRLGIRYMGLSGDRIFIPTLVVSLSDNSAVVRVSALRALGRLRATGRTEDILRVLEEDANLSVRLAAAGALSNIAGREFGYRRWALRAVKNPGWRTLVEVSVSAWKRWCAEMKNASYRSLLQSSLEGSQRSAETVAELESLKNSGTVEFLLNYISQEKTSLRIERSFLRRLLLAHESSEEAVRLSANYLLRETVSGKAFMSTGEIVEKEDGFEFSEKPWGEVINVLSGLWEAFFKGHLRSEADRSARSVLSDGDVIARLRDLGVLGYFTGIMNEVDSEDARFRKLAALAVGRMADVSAYPRLLALADEERDPEASAAMYEAALNAGGETAAGELARLAVTGPEKDLPLLLPVLRGAHPLKVLESIAPFAENADYHVRDRLAAVLGKLGIVDAVPLLAERLLDPEAPVRASSIDSLLKITGEGYGYREGLSREEVERIVGYFKAWHKRKTENR